jgi:hypothetical protein
MKPDLELQRINELIVTKEIEKPDSPFSQSVLIELLIRMDVLLQHLSRSGKRITYRDDVETDKSIGDITDLVSHYVMLLHTYPPVVKIS